MRNIDKHIDEILKHFDFTRVHKTMYFLNWTWRCSNESPSICELVSHASRLLKEVSKKPEDYFMASGGFKATNYGDYLVLEFILSEWDSGVKHYEIQI